MKKSVLITFISLMMSTILTSVPPIMAQGNADPKCGSALASLTNDTRPRLNELLDKVYGVHAFTDPPQSGVLPSNLRPTKHFALGSLVSSHPNGHHRDMHDWDGHAFAVLRSLRMLLPQLISLNTYDTFILGDIVLSPGDILVAPKNISLTLPHGVKLVTYEPQRGALRKIVSRVLESHRLWQFKMQDVANGEALFGKAKVNNPDFFYNLLHDYPHLSFGTHVRSKIGRGFVWGILDEANLFLTDPNSSPSIQDLVLAKAANTVLLPELEETVDIRLLPASARKTLDYYKNKISIYSQLIDLILKVQYEKGFTLRNNAVAKIATSATSSETLKIQFETALRMGEEQLRLRNLDFDAYIKSVKNNGHITRTITEHPFPAEALGANLRIFDAIQISQLKQKFPILFNGIVPDAFHLHYGIERFLEIGFEKAYKENLPQIIKDSYKKISSKFDLEQIAIQTVVRLVGKQHYWRLDAEISEQLKDLGRLQDVEHLLQICSD